MFLTRFPEIRYDLLRRSAIPQRCFKCQNRRLLCRGCGPPQKISRTVFGRQITFPRFYRCWSGAQWLRLFLVRMTASERGACDDFFRMVYFFSAFLSDFHGHMTTAAIFMRGVAQPMPVDCGQVAAQGFIAVIDYFLAAFHSGFPGGDDCLGICRRHPFDRRAETFIGNVLAVTDNYPDPLRMKRQRQDRQR